MLAVVGACAVLFPRIQLIVLFFPMPIRTFVLLFGVIYLVNVINQGVNAGGDGAYHGTEAAASSAAA